MTNTVEFMGGPLDGDLRVLQEMETGFTIVMTEPLPVSLSPEAYNPDARVPVIYGQYRFDLVATRRFADGHRRFTWMGWQ